ncbi:MAG: hypothetical protein ACMXYE_03020 [Candidatus Woesearchaeota archaeon]
MPQRNLSPEAAKLYTNKVHEDTAFVTRSGRLIRSMYELYSVISEMDDDEFAHHVTEDRNDFKNWVLHIVQDKHLARLLESLQTKSEMLDVIEKRVDAYKMNLQSSAKKTIQNSADKRDKQITEPSNKKLRKNTKSAKRSITKQSSTKKRNSMKLAKKKENSSSSSSSHSSSSRSSPIVNVYQGSNTEKETAVKEITNGIGSHAVVSKKRPQQNPLSQKSSDLKNNLKNNTSKRGMDYTRLEHEQWLERARAREFVQGLILGIIVGIILARIFFIG